MHARHRIFAATRIGEAVPRQQCAGRGLPRLQQARLIGAAEKPRFTDMTRQPTRRAVLASLAGFGAAASLGAVPAAAAGTGPKLMRAIPATGEQIPAIG